MQKDIVRTECVSYVIDLVELGNNTEIAPGVRLCLQVVACAIVAGVTDDEMKKRLYDI